MRPKLSVNDVIYSPEIDAKHSRKFALVGNCGCMEFPDCKNGFFGKNRNAVFFSRATSALQNHISHVVVMRSQKQVRRPNAQNRVAFMANENAFWNCSVVNQPRRDVSIYLPIPCGPTTQFTISPPSDSCRPKPAPFRLLNLCPKALKECFRKALRFSELVRKVRLHSLVAPYGLQALRRASFTLPVSLGDGNTQPI